MTYANTFKVDPAQNSVNPPLGAPQGQTAAKRVTAILRVVMAGIAECWAGLQALGDMAEQSSENVTITGGTISGVAIQGEIEGTAADATMVFGMTKQALYDAIWPIGRTVDHIGATITPPQVWTGVVATWTLVDAGRYLRTSSAADSGAEGGDASVDTSEAGAHDHGGVTIGHVLTLEELPTSVLTDVFQSGLSNTTPKTIAGGGALGLAVIDNDIGGGQSHNHPISPVAAHHHTLPLNPLYLNVAKYLRTA